MNSIIEQLAALPYVRRVVRSEGVIGALTNDSVGVNDTPPELKMAAFHAPMFLVGRADCEVLWDSVVANLRALLAGTSGVIGVNHRWCGDDELVEVEVGRNHDDTHRFSVRETETRPTFREGVYAVVVRPTPADRAQAVAAYDDSFLSSYQADKKRTYENAKANIIARAGQLFYSTKPANPAQAASQEYKFKACVQEKLRELAEATEAEDTPQARAAYVVQAKRTETQEERDAYLDGATRAACMERVSSMIGDIPSGVEWDVEIVFDGEQDERYKDMPC